MDSWKNHLAEQTRKSCELGKALESGNAAQTPNGSCPETSTGQELLAFSLNTHDRLCMLVTNLEDKLNVVLLPDNPRKEEMPGQDRQRAPLFYELYSHMKAMNDQLDRLSNIVMRIDL